jgi:hypothetical protein|tara:strand:+ start:1099 stop:1497 length:399 start_codon:yes stop_codon:yes gene_type:complete
MKMNEVADNFAVAPEHTKLSRFGRLLMDAATTTKDDALSNVMATVGNQLTTYGALFGPKNPKELVAKTGVSMEVIKKLLAYADKLDKSKSALQTDHNDSGLDDTDNDDNDFNEPDDDAMAAQADKAARAKRD